jgi:hypothetical protein
MYDIYRPFRKKDGTTDNILNIKISKAPTDKFVEFIMNDSSKRLEVLADEYYSDMSMYKFILMANPDLKDEFSIPHRYILRIPFPKSRVITEYEEKVRLYKEI